MIIDGQLGKDLDREFSTPMMQQYMDIKKQYPDCFLFFRLGDFYELFLNDAVIGAKVLGITLTARPRGKDGDIPMAGVPYHAAQTYLSRLVKVGYKVAICEQVSEPSKKGIVEREVIRIVTPGTVLNDSSLDGKENNHIISLSISKDNIGLTVADISTGKFLTTQAKFGDFSNVSGNSELSVKNKVSLENFLTNELTRFNPSECILSEELYSNKSLLKILNKVSGLNIFPFESYEDYSIDAKKYLKQHFQVESLRAFGIETKVESLRSSAVLLGYLQHTQKQVISHIKEIKSYKADNFVVLDRSTIINLELLSTIREGEKQGSLLSVIDHTVSSAGGRLLKKWLLEPLKNKTEIEKRLNFVEEALHNRKIRKELINYLSKIYDIERIVAKFSIGLGNPRDLINLKISFEYTLEIKKVISNFDSKLVKEVIDKLSNEVKAVINLINDNIKDDPKIDVRSGEIIKKGVNKKLDEIRSKVNGGKDWVSNLEKEERKRTGIGSLKIKFNKVFGYYIEISKSNLANIPENYFRKQTLVNAERFITPELKEYEELILTSQEVTNKLEYEIFQKTVEEILQFTELMQQVAKALAVIDCITSFSVLAQKENYCKPKMTVLGELKINNGRHPVVEKLLEDKQFVPNDVVLNSDDKQLLLITGPNMAGKSVFMRQVALIVLLAHMGSFIPASSATISVVDRIFVRSGASDNITSGLSTFMVEMVETAHILNHTTNKSLIIMDEIGRGTSTYDGISIAWAVAEYLVDHSNPNSKTLFATHYHELQALADLYPSKIKNYQVAIKDDDGKPVFLYKIIEGGAPHSFGVAVAKLAGVPKKVTDKSFEILKKLEKKVFNFGNSEEKLVELANLNIDNLTPIEALNMIKDLKEKYG